LTIFLSPLLIPGHPRPGNFFIYRTLAEWD
jgi:hypothetical protein